MKNLNIGARLGIGFGIVLLLLAAMTAIAVIRMQSANEITDRLINTSYKNQRLVSEWAKIIEINAVRTTAAWQTAVPAEQKAYEADIAAASGRSGEVQDTIDKSIRNPGVRTQYDQVLVARGAYVEVRKELFQLKTAGNLEQGQKVFETGLVPKAANYLAEVNKLQTMQMAAADGIAADVLASYSSTRTIIIALGLVALALGVGFALWITRSITGPINRALEVAETVSAGDLTSVITVDSRDETGRLMQALKNMNDNLVKIVAQVRSGTDTMATASAEIAAGNQDLSSRTEQQASSLEETASSMEELTATVRQNADNAREANRLAQDAAGVANRGGAVVADVVSTMGSINDSSRKIVDIISVIDGIAFQTNILALNAAVEAARAGEQGRGFAVVATEVRNLAQRSAAAAKEIKGLIDDSVQKVEAGSALVDQAGHTMTEIVQGISQVTSIMGEITSASVEQSAGIEQVNQAITEMDQVTQQNAALVEEASAAAEAMQEQAAGLSEVVSVFKLDGLTQANAPRRAAKPAASAPLRKPAAAPARLTAAPSASSAATASKPAAPRKASSAATAKADANEWEEF
jgi:methyl-accepting chemotaxis protein